MPKKRFSAEQIVVPLRQIEVPMSQGKSAPVTCREAGISQQSARTIVVYRCVPRGWPTIRQAWRSVRLYFSRMPFPSGPYYLVINQGRVCAR